ncbi:exo-alpha-sialidase [Thermodesulfobacteriota bacterium]
MRKISIYCGLAVLFLIALVTGCGEDGAGGVAEPAYFDETDVFVSQTNGYETYRIPSLIVTAGGTVLAFCEGRKAGSSDTGDIDIVLRRSRDSGVTWGSMSVVIDNGADTAGNPCPVVDRDTGTIWLPFTTNLGTDTESEIIHGTSEGTREVFIIKSTDDGLTWSEPVNITDDVKPAGWTWYATGPGRGIQLAGGRFVIPCNHVETGLFPAQSCHSRSHVIYSDDHGETWDIGGVLDGKTNESQVAELDDGTLIINMRSYRGRRRAVSRSYDAGMTWDPVTLDRALIEPVCQGSLISHDGFLFFSNPASWTRMRMTVRRSSDNGVSWEISKVLNEGPAAYSALSALPNTNIACLYEKGDLKKIRLYDRIVLARFSMEWLTN